MKPLIFSYTHLNTYSGVCPYQYYRRYVKKDIPYVASEAMAWGNEVHTAFEYRIAAGKPLPDKMRQWETFAVPFDNLKPQVELKLGIDRNCRPVDFFDADVKIRGKLDCVVMNDSAAYLVDWKSGYSKYENPFELEIGAMLLQAKYPQLQTIMGSYAWLAENRLGVSYNLPDVNATFSKVSALIGQIEDDINRGEFEKRRGPLCSYCDVKDCQFNKKKA